MIEIHPMQLLIGFIAAMGIPSALFGFALRRFEHCLAARDKAQDERQAVQARFFQFQIQTSGAAIALAEATARAVQRIPDAKCNGDMHAALEYAAEVKHQQKDFLAAQGIHAIWGEDHE